MSRLHEWHGAERREIYPKCWMWGSWSSSAVLVLASIRLPVSRSKECTNLICEINFLFLPARICRIQAGTESQKSVPLSVCLSAVISSSSSSPSSLEEGSSRTCVGAVPRDLSLYDIMSGIRWLLLHSNKVFCTILSVERCSLGNTSLHRDQMTPPLQQYSSVLYYTILYYTKRFPS